MAAAIVYDGVPTASGTTSGGLFAGQKFWFSHSVPQRKWMTENAEANGAEVVLLEKQADVLLVDHTRKNAAPGSHSYRYVEVSIRNGVLEDLADHAVGAPSRASRPVGSVTMAPKGGRNAYTEAEDQLLWDWVWPYQQMGERSAGNVIYQQLESVNSRHTYQSWRDRWLKKVQFQNREVTERNIRDTMLGELAPGTQGTVGGRSRKAVDGRRQERHVTPAEPRMPTGKGKRREIPDAEDSDPVRSQTAQDAATPPRKQARRPPSPTKKAPGSSSRSVVLQAQSRRSPAKENGESPTRSPHTARMASGGDGHFERSDAIMLLRAATHILNSDEGTLDDGWKKVAKEYPSHTMREWKDFFFDNIVPVHQRRLAKYGDVGWDSPEDEEAWLRSVLDDLMKGESDGSEVADESEHQDEEASDGKEAEDDATERTKVMTPKTVKPDASALRRNVVDRGSSPIVFPEQTLVYQQVRRGKSPSFEPQTPTLTRAPAPNQGKKRSPGKSSKPNSQDSEVSAPVGSQNVEVGSMALRETQIANPSVQSSPSKRKRDDEDDGRRLSQGLPSLEDIMGQRQKRVKRLGQVNEKGETMEIPLTPPEAARRSESPLFMSQDGDESDIGGEDNDDEDDNDETNGSNEERFDEDNFIEIVDEEDEKEEAGRQNAGNAEMSPEEELPVMHPTLYPQPRSGAVSRLFQRDQRRRIEQRDDEAERKEDEGSEAGSASGTRYETAHSEDEEGRTSPLGIKLVSDPDEPPPSAFSQTLSQRNVRRDDDDEGDEDRQTPEFDGTPEISDVWETAPEDIYERDTKEMLTDEGEDDDDDDLEIIHGVVVEEEEFEEEIVEENAGDDTITVSRNRERIATQALFEQDEIRFDADHFALPEPEGGWGDEEDEEQPRNDEPEIPETYQLLAEVPNRNSGDEERADLDADLPEPPPRPSEAASSSSLDIDAYVDDQLAKHPELDEEFLLMAADATSLNPELIPMVYESIMAGRGVPQKMQGVWTEEDNRALRGTDPAAVAAVMEKHGDRAVNRRWIWWEG